MAIEPELATQFGRVGEFTRALFESKITAYFNTPEVVAKLTEIPNIEKYEIADTVDDSFATYTQIVKYFPDIFEKLPLIAITTVGGRRRPMSVGFPTLSMKNHNPVLESSTTEPYTLAVGDDFRFSIGDKEYAIAFYAGGLPDFNNVTIDDLREYINQVFGTLRVRETENKLALVDVYGRDIYIVGGEAVTKLGFTAGQGPDTSKHYEWLTLAEDMEVLVDVAVSGRNQRIELMDILTSLLGFYVYDNDIGQWFAEDSQIGQIIFKDELTRRGETEQIYEGPAPESKVYSDSLSIPVTTLLFLERVKVDEDVENIIYFP